MASSSLFGRFLKAVKTPFMECGEKILDIPQPHIACGLDLAVPALFVGITRLGSSSGGAAQLIDLMDKPELGPAMIARPKAYLDGGENTLGLTSLGEALMPCLLGDRLTRVIGAIAAASGLTIETAFRLTVLATPLALSFMKVELLREHADSRALSSALMEQASSIGRSLDVRLAKAFEVPKASASSWPEPQEEAPAIPGPRWLLALFIAGIPLLLGVQLISCAGGLGQP